MPAAALAALLQGAPGPYRDTVLLNASAADTTWAITATLLAGAVATPTVGRLADMLGKRRMLMVCLIVLVAGLMEGAGEEKISDVARIDGDELCKVAGGAVPVGCALSGVLSDQGHVEESGREHMF